MAASLDTDLQQGSVELHQLVDRQKIYEVIVRYCRGIDRVDKEMVLSAYHEGATDDHGTFSGAAVDFVHEAVPRAWTKYDALMHVIGNHLVEFATPDLARSESYVIAHHYVVQDDRAILDLVYGRYVDRFERRDGVWKIAHRVFVCEWSETRDIDTSWNAKAPFVRGRRAPDDVVYEPLLP